jgi:iduronate 2-sulfatase
MKRMNLYIFLLVVVACSALWSFAVAQPRKPNVLFISVDDLNSDLGCYGHPQVKSPNIDRLAARGLRFDRAYVQYPLCNPSRASFLSGRRPETTGIFELQTAPRKAMPDAVFLPQLFRQNGYFTARYGKVFHEGRDDKLSWDISENVEFTDAQERAMHQKRYANPPGKRTPDWTPLDTPEAQTRDARTAQAIAQLMKEKNKAGQPFFLAAGLNKPHLPWNVPKDYFVRYPADRIKLQPDLPLRNIPSIALMTELFGSPQPASRAEAIAAYYAAITYMDAQVGVLLDKLDEFKLWDNTIVVLFSDHGFHLGDHGGLWAKLTLFEQAARIPLIIAAPQIKQSGQASPRVVEVLDLYPTLAALCQLPMPAGLEGRSLTPLLAQPNRKWPHAAYTMVYHERDGEKVEGKSVRDERWRYTEWDAGRKGAELYDHQRDPREFTNLAADAHYAKIVQKMKQLLERK